ncbi:MAG: hypothetical protein ABIR62_06870 [Dokdonella sp.]|uniref:hypothetical protein n=1 Tax=Dokdonella sp. TaxID=2291710 RepID=UPI003267D093
MNAILLRRRARKFSIARARSIAAIFALSVCASAPIILAPVAASAQTCDAPVQLPLSPARPSAAAWTCAEPAGLPLCRGTATTTSPSAVFKLTIGAGNTASLMAIDTTGQMDPQLYLTGPGCGGRACIQGAGFLPLHDVAPGDYSLIVTASEIDAAGSCGDVTLFLDGDLAPVDRVFFDGFD